MLLRRWRDGGAQRLNRRIGNLCHAIIIFSYQHKVIGAHRSDTPGIPYADAVIRVAQRFGYGRSHRLALSISD